MSMLNSKYTRILTVVLVLQVFAFYGIASRRETVPSVLPLSAFPSTFSGWNMTADTPIDKETADVLKATDTLNRAYSGPKAQEARLFIAYFQTQRTGASPHSPKNCLPGAGFEPLESGTISLRVPGEAAPITINKYVVQHGDEQSVTLYWYQSHRRIIANEFSAKFWLVADSVRYHRSDTALVRIWVPVRDNDIEGASATGIELIEAVFPELLKQLPS